MIYPVPVSSELGVRSSETIAEIRILDVLGNEIVKKANLKTTNHKLQTSNLSPGIYFIRVKTKDGAGSAKFIKN